LKKGEQEGRHLTKDSGINNLKEKERTEKPCALEGKKTT